MEERIIFTSDELTLEGKFAKNDKDRAVIITHPHPQYGGDMHNKVVGAIQTAYSACQYSTLRFNFRGTGSSEGYFDDGVGEQADVFAAFEFLEQQDYKIIELAGYSFGAWVNAQAASKRNPFYKMIFVAPPVDFIEFKNIDPMPNLSLVIIGDNDEFASISNVRKSVSYWGDQTEIKIIEGTDHFFMGACKKLESLISSSLSR